jgi:hypothetical protein
MIVCFDPGITTGVATYHNGAYNFLHLQSTNLINVYEFLDRVYSSTIGFEDFQHRPNLMKAELYSKEVIGVIRLWSHQHLHTEPFRILPSEAKAFWTDKKIKSIGLWKPGESYEHAMDALRVLLTYRMKNDKKWFEEVMRTCLKS